jgi:hypothetical protein
VKVLNKDFSVIDQQSIISAGEKALVTVCHGNEGETLNTLRVRRFTQKVAESRSVVEPASLPPTSASARYHILRVYHQVQSWKGEALPPEEWG